MEAGGGWRGIAFDLDGTLLLDDHSVPEDMHALCADLTSNQVWITLASARPPRSVRAIGSSLGLQGPYVCLNGAIVSDADGACLARNEMPPDLVTAFVAKFSDDPRLSLSLYTDRDWLAPRIDARVLEEARAVGFQPTLLQPESVLPAVAKVLLMTSSAEVDSVLAECEGFASELNVTRSLSTYIEITSKSATKAGGLAIAAASKGISLKQLVVAGDGENDIPMLLASGFGIAMGHASAPVRAAAKCVVGSSDDGSLAKLLRALTFA